MGLCQRLRLIGVLFDQESYEYSSDDRANGRATTKQRRLSLPLVLSPNPVGLSKPGTKVRIVTNVVY